MREATVDRGPYPYGTEAIEHMSFLGDIDEQMAAAAEWEEHQPPARFVRLVEELRCTYADGMPRRGQVDVELNAFGDYCLYRLRRVAVGADGSSAGLEQWLTMSVHDGPDWRDEPANDGMRGRFDDTVRRSECGTQTDAVLAGVGVSLVRTGAEWLDDVAGPARDEAVRQGLGEALRAAGEQPSDAHRAVLLARARSDPRGMARGEWAGWLWAARATIGPGTTVELRGVRSRPELNGQRGTVCGQELRDRGGGGPPEGRWLVEVGDSGRAFKVPGANLVSPQAELLRATASDPDDDSLARRPARAAVLGRLGLRDAAVMTDVALARAGLPASDAVGRRMAVVDAGGVPHGERWLGDRLAKEFDDTARFEIIDCYGAARGEDYYGWMPSPPSSPPDGLDVEEPGRRTAQASRGGGSGGAGPAGGGASGAEPAAVKPGRRRRARARGPWRLLTALQALLPVAACPAAEPAMAPCGLEGMVHRVGPWGLRVAAPRTSEDTPPATPTGASQR